MECVCGRIQIMEGVNWKVGHWRGLNIFSYILQGILWSERASCPICLKHTSMTSCITASTTGAATCMQSWGSSVLCWNVLAQSLIPRRQPRICSRLVCLIVLHCCSSKSLDLAAPTTWLRGSRNTWCIEKCVFQYNIILYYRGGVVANKFNYGGEGGGKNVQAHPQVLVLNNPNPNIIH